MDADDFIKKLLNKKPTPEEAKAHDEGFKAGAAARQDQDAMDAAYENFAAVWWECGAIGRG